MHPYQGLQGSKSTFPSLFTVCKTPDAPLSGIAWVEVDFP
jgi:hypothetical protein